MELVEGGNLAEKIAVRASTAAAGRRPGGPAGRGRPRGPPAADHSSRFEARQHPDDGRRDAEDLGFWPGQAAGRDINGKRGEVSRHGQLRRSRAGRGASGRSGCGHRRVRPGGHPVRDADGPAAVPRRVHVGDVEAGGGQRAGAAEQLRSGAARSGNDLSEVSGQGAGPALCVGASTGRGPAAVSGRPAHPGSAGGLARAPGQVGEVAGPRWRR